MESKSRVYIITSCIVFTIILLPVSVFVSVCAAYLFCGLVFAILDETTDVWMEVSTYTLSVIIFLRMFIFTAGSSIASLFGMTVGLTAASDKEYKIYERA